MTATAVKILKAGALTSVLVSQAHNTPAPKPTHSMAAAISIITTGRTSLHSSLDFAFELEFTPALLGCTIHPTFSLEVREKKPEKREDDEFSSSSELLCVHFKGLMTRVSYLSFKRFQFWSVVSLLFYRMVLGWNNVFYFEIVFIMTNGRWEWCSQWLFMYPTGGPQTREEGAARAEQKRATLEDKAVFASLGP